MKTDKVIYWVSTTLISVMMLFAGYAYFTNPMIKSAFIHLGFPDYFRLELASAKILGSLALILPMIPLKIKEFAYSGFTITFVSAIIAHISSNDPIKVVANPVIAFIILAVSYIYFLRIQKEGNTK